MYKPQYRRDGRDRKVDLEDQPRPGDTEKDLAFKASIAAARNHHCPPPRLTEAEKAREKEWAARHV